jgi:hypothetical protein
MSLDGHYFIIFIRSNDVSGHYFSRNQIVHWQKLVLHYSPVFSCGFFASSLQQVTKYKCWWTDLKSPRFRKLFNNKKSSWKYSELASEIIYLTDLTTYFKGIVSRDFVVYFWCHSIDLKFLRENRKIIHEMETLKANEPAPYVKELQIYRMIPRNLVRLSL